MTDDADVRKDDPVDPPPPKGWVNWCKEFIPGRETPNSCLRCSRIKSWH